MYVRKTIFKSHAVYSLRVSVGKTLRIKNYEGSIVRGKPAISLVYNLFVTVRPNEKMIAFPMMNNGLKCRKITENNTCVTRGLLSVVVIHNRGT